MYWVNGETRDIETIDFDTATEIFQKINGFQIPGMEDGEIRPFKFSATKELTKTQEEVSVGCFSAFLAKIGFPQKPRHIEIKGDHFLQFVIEKSKDPALEPDTVISEKDKPEDALSKAQKEFDAMKKLSETGGPDIKNKLAARCEFLCRRMEDFQGEKGGDFKQLAASCKAFLSDLKKKTKGFDHAKCNKLTAQLVEKYTPEGETHNFSGLKLEDYTFTREANLRKSNFQNAELKNVNFNNAKLDGSNFDAAEISFDAGKPGSIKNIGLFTNNCSFVGAKLTNLLIRLKSMENCDFTDATIKDSKFQDISMEKSNFTGAKISNSEFELRYGVPSSLKFYQAKLEGVKLEGNFQKSSFNDATFTNCDLKADISNSSFVEANLAETKFNPHTGGNNDFMNIKWDAKSKNHSESLSNARSTCKDFPLEWIIEQTRVR